jgi:hypothetical protein
MSGEASKRSGFEIPQGPLREPPKGRKSDGRMFGRSDVRMFGCSDIQTGDGSKW